LQLGELISNRVNALEDQDLSVCLEVFMQLGDQKTQAVLE